MEAGILMHKFLGHLLDGDRKNAAQIAEEFLATQNDITDLYEQVIKPALYEVGLLWERNEITVATEHMATAVTEGLLNQLYQKISEKAVKPVAKKVVVACVENELHQVGVKMVADVFEMNGWESLYLGNGVPLQELLNFIATEEPDLLAISLSVYFNYSALQRMIRKIHEAHADLPILIGGQALTRVDPKLLSSTNKIFYLPDLYLLERFIQSLNS